MHSNSLDRESRHRESWLPMLVIAMGQMIMSFNFSALAVSISGIVTSLNTPETSVGSALVTYSLVIAAFIMLGLSWARSSARAGCFRQPWLFSACR